MANVAQTLLGGFFVSVFVACTLYGITLLQSFIYFQLYPNDAQLLRLMVTAICVIETVHTSISIVVVYDYFVANFGSIEDAIQVVWGVGVIVILEVVVSTLVQAFYVYRIWILSGRKKFITSILGFLTACRLAFGIVTTALSYGLGTWPAFRTPEHLPILITIGGGLGCAALVDIALAVTLSYYLRRGRKDRPKASQSRINAIMLYTVNTGALTSITSLVAFVVCIVEKNNVVFLGLLTIQTKLYANSFLGSLNARSMIRDKSRSGNDSTPYASFGESINAHSRFRPNLSANHASSNVVPTVEVFKQTVVTDDMGNVHEPDVDNIYALQTMKTGELV